MKNWHMLIIGGAIVLAAWAIYHAHLTVGNASGIPAVFSGADIATGTASALSGATT